MSVLGVSNRQRLIGRSFRKSDAVTARKVEESDYEIALRIEKLSESAGTNRRIRKGLRRRRSPQSGQKQREGKEKVSGDVDCRGDARMKGIRKVLRGDADRRRDARMNRGIRRVSEETQIAAETQERREE